MLGRVLRLAEENHGKFAHGDCRFRFQDGYADLVEDARAGRLAEVAAASGSYVFQGDHGRYERAFPLDVLAANTIWTDLHHASSRLLSLRQVTNGKATIREEMTAGIDGALSTTFRGVVPDRAQFDMHVVFPIHLGRPSAVRGDFTSGIRQLLDGSPHLKLLRLDPKATREGRSLVQMILTRNNTRYESWIDMERGGIVVYQRTTSPTKRQTEEFQDDIRLVPGHGWLPFVWTSYSQNEGRTHRILVEQAEFDRPLAATAFQITLSEPFRLSDPTTDLPYPKAQRTWDLDNLPR